MTARSSSSSQKEYKKAGLVSINFPPNNGDLNPIEAVWAKLNKDLAAREFEDLRCVAQFFYLPKTKGGPGKGTFSLPCWWPAASNPFEIAEIFRRLRRAVGFVELFPQRLEKRRKIHENFARRPKAFELFAMPQKIKLKKHCVFCTFWALGLQKAKKASRARVFSLGSFGPPPLFPFRLILVCLA